MFNGFLISSVGVQPVILTLVMRIVMRGVTVLMAKSSVFVLGGYPEIKTPGHLPLSGRVPIQIVFSFSSSLSACLCCAKPCWASMWRPWKQPKGGPVDRRAPWP